MSCRSEFTYIIILSAFAILFACSPDAAEEKTSIPESLEGSWRLIQTIEIGHEDSTGRKDSDERIYIKHITPTHFTWLEYDRVEQRLAGTGGGTYTLKDGIYTENIEFYFPPGSNELGQAIPFKASIEDGKWRHTGYVKILEFDPETGENVQVDTAIIDELWEPVAEQPNVQTDLDLIGSWELKSYKEQGDSVYSEYPEFTKVVRHVTPTHYLWVYYSTVSDEVLMQGGGTYSITNDRFVENVIHAYSTGDQIQTGVEFPFTVRLQDNLWHHYGEINVSLKDSISGERGGMDTLIIDEIWKPI